MIENTSNQDLISRLPKLDFMTFSCVGIVSITPLKDSYDPFYKTKYACFPFLD